jgi:2-iminobutanoate/2-iminopropanoate deaminase
MPTFVTPPARDPELLAKYGLGGAAVVGDLIFAGSMAIDLATLTRLPEADSVASETRICFEQIEATLGAAGAALRDVARITCYVSDDSHREEMTQTLNEIFAPGPYPKRVTIAVGIAAECRVEFEVIAVKPGEAA